MVAPGAAFGPRRAAPTTGLFANERSDDISYPIETNWTDAREGKLANVVFVDPNDADRAGDMGTSNGAASVTDPSAARFARAGGSRRAPSGDSN